MEIANMTHVSLHRGMFRALRTPTNTTEQVASINKECDRNSCPVDPTNAVVYQKDPPSQLSYLSWPEYLPEPLKRYHFDGKRRSRCSSLCTRHGSSFGS